MRATNYKHYGPEQHTAKSAKASKKSRKALKATSFGFAFVIAAAAFIVPTTTLAPGVEAYADSRVASYSVGDIDKFSSIITSNCVEVTTAPETEATTVEETKTESTVEETTEAVKETKAEDTKAETGEETAEETETETDAKAETSAADTQASESEQSSDTSVAYSGATLIDIAYPDYSYSPSYVSMSAYDRAKTERLVMGEAGTMGFTGAALVAQSIRDAMNRSGTSSIDQIIDEYQYYGSTAMEPNQDVKDAVSYIFDQNASAVQHRVLCFYIGYSSWHETQTFITSIGGVRFFDLNA